MVDFSFSAIALHTYRVDKNATFIVCQDCSFKCTCLDFVGLLFVCLLFENLCAIDLAL